MSKHARLGPSNHRWPNCPGSVRVEAPYPDISSESAIDGTGTHLLIEMCFDNNVPPSSYEGATIGANHYDKPLGWTIHKERIERAEVMFAYVERRKRELSEQYPGCTVTIESERKVDPGGAFGRGDWNGTCDCTIIVILENQVRFVEVVDYKDGRMWVTEKDNTQLQAYLFGALRPFVASGPELVQPFKRGQIDGVRMTIVQPKTSTPIRYQDATVDSIFDKAIELSFAAYATDDPNAPLVPDGKAGEGYCRWCKHRSACDALLKQNSEVIQSMDTSIVPTIEGDLTTIDAKELSNFLDKREQVLAVFKQVEEEILRRIDTGLPTPGYKMLPGRNSKVWALEEDEIAKMLKGRKFKKDEIYPSKLISPAQVLGSKNLDAKQKETILSKYIVEKAGADKLTRVEYDEVEDMFADIVVEEITFI